ncbi:Fe-S cluster assembly protein HesB [Rubrobacter marinus]|uniref:DNA-(apurinic or apyrimidinic site) lyase n=1 Tax=Rubrobacter marinus TaxID=2653852 RepID=A0A6G8Q1E4_9ACTN|nr:DNA-3-methyladenine glycosylase 2 family protein [Rubrobacter marinus]QIN80268.1 Fe-S cluster assembly protein HesB [Rubrobacter marinus]
MDGRPWRASFALAGPAGEPVDLARAFRSHGLASLPPMRLDEETDTLEATLPVRGYAPRTVLIRADGSGAGLADVLGPAPEAEEGERILRSVRHVLRLDEDLSPFYGLAAGDPELAWATRGAGRMIRGATVFEEVVKTICTTNCAWSATTRMIGALVEHLGERAVGAPRTGTLGRAFPTPEAMARAGEDFYGDVVRAGYRGRYLLSLSRSVVEGALDLEALDTPAEVLPDEELERRLLALPGVGPYAAAHVMMMLGRYSRLILDSWTRPTYARLAGKEEVSDGEIVERFSPYGRYAGLAFWLYLTRGWIEEPEKPVPSTP